MMYNSKFVCALKSSKGQILREFKDTVYVPFGEEYSLYFKNLNNRRVSVSVSIDGEDVLNGASVIIDANRELNLERFLTNLNSGNRFKFIERTSKIEQHRGIQAEDGLIRVEFEFEKEVPSHWGSWNSTNVYTRMKGSSQIYGSTYSDNSELNSIRCSSLSAAPSASYSTMDTNITTTYQNTSVPQNEVGITVPGSISTQKFTEVNNFIGDGQSNVIVLKLVGELGQQPVQEAVTVKAKPKCVTCGRVNKAGSKFCTECGTSLQIIA